MRHLPKYVHGFIDRHGKPRFYFRRPGFEIKPLRGLPYSAEFMGDYEAALAGQPLPVGANKTRPGTMRALALSYFASPEFHTLRPSTQRAYRGIMERLCKEHGDRRAADLRRDHVVRLMAARAEQPGAANGLRRALRVMMKHAVEIGLRADDPTREVRPYAAGLRATIAGPTTRSLNSSGIIRWTLARGWRWPFCSTPGSGGAT
jgi:hypothetical protein